jgi:hypothetical protein
LHSTLPTNMTITLPLLTSDPSSAFEYGHDHTLYNSSSFGAHLQLPTLHFDKRRCQDNISSRHSVHICSHVFSLTPLHTSPPDPSVPISHNSTQKTDQFLNFSERTFTPTDATVPTVTDTAPLLCRLPSMTTTTTSSTTTRLQSPYHMTGSSALASSSAFPTPVLQALTTYA